MNLHPPVLVGSTCLALLLGACANVVTSDEPFVAASSSDDPKRLGPDVGSPPTFDAPTPYSATLTGLEVVPPVATTAARGTGEFALDLARHTLRYRVTHTVAAATAAHLHLGIAGASGDVLLPLDATSGGLFGEVAVTAAQARSLADGGAYVDVHSADHPAGEVRGQVVRPGEVVYVARLTPDQERVAPDTDADGLGAFLVDATARRMRFSVQTTGLHGAALAAVVGLGPAGVDGPMVLDLAEAKTLPAATFSGERALGPSADLDLGRWYVQLPTRGFPRGELRGQILRPAQSLYVASLTGADVLPPTQSVARGTVSVIVDAPDERVAYDFALPGLTATSAWLGAGPAGAALLSLRAPAELPRGRRLLVPNSPLAAALAAGDASASVASADFPDGELRGPLRRVGAAR